MEFLNSILEALNGSMEVPTQFGWFHILWLVLSILVNFIGPILYFILGKEDA